MKKTIIAICAAITLYNCTGNPQRIENQKGVTYTICVYYIDKTKDTLTVTLHKTEPFMYVSETGLSCLCGDGGITYPIASYVKSFVVINKH